MPSNPNSIGSNDQTEQHVAKLLYWADCPDRLAAQRAVDMLTTELIEATGLGLILTGANLAGRNLAGFNLRFSNLSKAQLHDANMRTAKLEGATLICPGMERTDLSGASLVGANLHALAAQACNLCECDLSGVVDATGSLFHGCNLSRVKGNNAVLSGASFYQCNMDDSRFVEASLQGATFNECSLRRASLLGAKVDGAVILNSPAEALVLSAALGDGLILRGLSSANRLRLDNASLPGLRMNRVCGERINAKALVAPGGDFQDCVLSRASFAKSSLRKSRWDSCILDEGRFTNADLTAASMTCCSITNGHFNGVSAENLRLLDSRAIGADFQQIVARCFTARNCDLSNSNWTGAYLYRAMITGDPSQAMSLREACFSGANLAQAYIAADLDGADLNDANASYSRLNQSSLREANLTGVNISNSSIVKADFTAARLSGLKGQAYVNKCIGFKPLELALHGQVGGIS